MSFGNIYVCMVCSRFFFDFLFCWFSAVHIRWFESYVTTNSMGHSKWKHNHYALSSSYNRNDEEQEEEEKKYRDENE